jgi:hypothetical protein
VHCIALQGHIDSRGFGVSFGHQKKCNVKHEVLGYIHAHVGQAGCEISLHHVRTEKSHPMCAQRNTVSKQREAEHWIPHTHFVHL